MQRWIKDLSWRVGAGEKEIKRRFEPDREKQVERLLTDETETSVFNNPALTVRTHTWCTPTPCTLH